MNTRLRIRVTHAARNKSFERTVDSCPIAFGRDQGLVGFVLDGDDSVSKVHASVDVHGDRLVVRDVRSTNGTFATAGRLEPDRWVDVGAAAQDNEIQIGGWRVLIRGEESPLGANLAPFAVNGETTFDSLPFGASLPSSAGGDTGGASFLVSFAGVVDQLSERVLEFRLARMALDQAVAGALSNVAEHDRPGLASTLATHYPELAERLAPPAASASVSSPAHQALTAMRELAGHYEGKVTTPSELDAFKERLRSGFDALIHGLVEALAGVNAYAGEMNLSLVSSANSLPRTAREFARAVLGARDGAGLVRRGFHEVAIHQVASFNATLSGVHALLNELAPESIEEVVSRDLASQGPWRRLWSRMARSRLLLEAYRRRHHDLSTEENARFALIFGRRFADEYHAIVRETAVSVSRSSVTALAAPLAPATAPVPQIQGGTVPLGAPFVSRGANPDAGGTVPLAPLFKPRDPRSGSRP